MKFLVLNQYKSDNIGDQLINLMLCENLQKSNNCCFSQGFAQTSVHQISGCMQENKLRDNIANLKHFCPIIIKYWLKYKKELGDLQKQKELAECDVILVGGGQLMKHHSIFLYCMMNWMKFAKKNDIPLALWGIGVDDNLNWFEIMIYKKVLEYATYINVRDSNSAQIVKRYFKIDCSVSPDIAFTYIPPRKVIKGEHKLVVMPYNYKIAVRCLDYKKPKERYYEDIIKLIYERTEFKRDFELLLTATTSEDCVECVHFQKFLKEKNIKSVIKEISTIDELVDILLESSWVITGRMHAMIMALLCGKEVIPIEVSNKIKGFKDEFLLETTDNAVLRNKALQGLKECIGYFEKKMVS